MPPSRVEIEAGDVAERLVDEDRAKARHEAEAKQDVLGIRPGTLFDGKPKAVPVT